MSVFYEHLKMIEVNERAYITGTITPPTSYGIELCVRGNNNLT